MLKCAICGREFLYVVPKTCNLCGATLDAARHDELRHLDFILKELATEEIAALMPTDAKAQLLALYQSRRRRLISELQPPHPVPPEVITEAREAEEKVSAGPPELPEKREPAAVLPEAHQEPEPPVARIGPQPFRPDFARWGERLIRSLLYLGIFGLICTVLLIIYGPKYEIAPGVKLGVLVLITAGIYALGYALRYRFDLVRTGLALIFLSLSLVPLDYLAAKRFGLLPAEHTIIEWFSVALFCTILYGAVGVIIGESALIYLTTITGATTTGLLLGHIGWFDSRRFVEIALVFTLFSALYLIISTYSREKRRDAMPFLIASQLIMGFVLFTLIYYASQSRFLAASAISAMITAYYVAAYCMQRIGTLIYIPSVSLIATTVLLTLSKTTDVAWLSLAISVPAGAYLFLGAYSRVPEKMLPGLPLRRVSLAAMIIVVILLVVAVPTSLIDDNYSRTVVIGLIATAYFIPSALSRGEPREMYIPAVTFTVTGLFCLLAIVPGRYNVSPGWFCISLALGACGYVLARLKKNDYARPFYGTSYCFSLVPFVIALVSLGLRLSVRPSELPLESSSWFHTPTIAAGLLLAAAYYLWCAHAAEKFFNVYLSVGAAAGLIALGVSVSPLPVVAVFMFLSFFALTLGLFAFRKRDAPWSLPLYWSSHAIAGINMLYLIWVVAAKIVEDYSAGAAVFPVVTSVATMGFYLYSVLERRERLLAYLTVATGYLAVAIILLAGFDASYMQTRIVVALVSLAAVGLEHRLRHMRDTLWREPLLAVRNVVIGAVVIVALLYRAFSVGLEIPTWRADVNLVSLYLIAAVTAIATAVTRHDEHDRKPALYTFVGGALFFVAAITLLRDVVHAPNRSLPLYTVGISVPYLVAGRLLSRLKDKTHCWSAYALATLLSAFAIAISLPHRASAIFTCVGASFVYGILAYSAKKDAFLYASILSFSLAYLFTLTRFAVPAHTYGLYFLVICLFLVLVGKAIRPGATRIEDNPFYVVGAVISAVVVASLFFAGRIYFATEINISIAVTVAAALVYAIFGFFLSSRRFFLLSGAMLLGTYYLFLLKYRVTISPAYTFPPAAILVGLGIAAIRATGAPASVTARWTIAAGLILFFMPAFIKTVVREDFLEGLLIMVFGISIIHLSMRLKVKILFAGAALAVAGDILLQIVQLMRSATIPRELYIGTGSVILIFMGCLAEKRFKAAVAGTVQRTKSRIAGYFEGWA